MIQFLIFPPFQFISLCGMFCRTFVLSLSQEIPEKLHYLKSQISKKEKKVFFHMKTAFLKRKMCESKCKMLQDKDGL